ncbi:hypothetical protein FSB78_00785 [Sphingomonas ginsenosidivorax]|uniref:Uncharacterized protein n=1 Tax=Sphingomonas ginsenosidivorax TaxID=862135 RepID=A0A5C6U9Y8_9SPHN|nr:hypothetical protein [Sphingomonas ginsenosidivorax]TXC69659.1 hypothetical protein FSB78_00785 [Sphingomonas ginsenosidivorax]
MTHPSNPAETLRVIEAQLARCLELADSLQEFVVGAFICTAHQTTLTRLNELGRVVPSITPARTPRDT